ncbi:hypothetical protein [Domibacillus indicus]|nr:hypothetical protein [Domibacillus indicus]
MNEFVGSCVLCGKDVYCQDGFLNGVKEEGGLHCFECAEQNE